MNRENGRRDKASKAEKLQLDFRLAFSLFNDGNLDQSKKICEDALRIDPKNFDFLHLLALNLFRQGKLPESKKVFEQAARVNSQSPVFLSNYGTLLKELSLYEEAVKIFSKAIALRPDYANAHFNLGTALSELRRFDEAIKTFQTCLALNPGDAEVYYNLGIALFETHQLAMSLDAYKKAIAIIPQFAAAHNNAGIVLVKMKRPEEALGFYQTAISIKPEDAEVYNNYGSALQELKRYDQAIEMFDRALALRSNYSEAFNNKGNALSEMGRLDEALVCFNAALNCDPNHAGAYNGRGLLNWRFCNWASAISDLDRSVEIEPHSAQFIFNRSTAYLGSGRFWEGWRDYDKRLDVPGHIEHFSNPIATVHARALRNKQIGMINGADVLLIDEQGIGDTIMFLSMLPDLMAQVRRVRLVIESRLVSLVKASFPDLEIQSVKDFESRPEIRDNERIIFTGSLGSQFRRERNDFPGTPYLKPSPERQNIWKEKLLTFSTRRKIGLSWKGGTPKTNAVMRSLGLVDFQPLSLLDVDLVNLQYGSSPDDLLQAGKSFGRDMISFAADETNDIHDLAALIASLDAVVTVQNSNVHICGAIGTRCLAILPHVPEWRYGIEGTHMPWYGSVELFRRSMGDDPQDMIKTACTRLASIL